MVFLVVVLKIMFWIQSNFLNPVWDDDPKIDDFWTIWDGLNPPTTFFREIHMFFFFVDLGQGMSGVSIDDSLAAWVPYPGGIQTRAAPVHSGSCTAVTRRKTCSESPIFWCRISHTLPATPPSKSDFPISTMWGPPVISWFISPSNYSYKYHKP